VNGYSATFGRAFEIRVSSDDLPAFGRPTRAASARSFRRSSISRSSPGRPTSANRGVCRLGPSNCLFPTREVGDELVSLEHLSAYGHREHRVLAARAVRQTVATPSATARPELLVRP